MEPITQEDLDFAALMEEWIVEGVGPLDAVERMLSVVVPDAGSMVDYVNERCAQGDAGALRDLAVAMIGQVRVMSTLCRSFDSRVH